MMSTTRYCSFLLLAAALGCGGGAGGTEEGTAADSSIILGSRDVYTVEPRVMAGGVAVTGSLDPALRVDVKAQLAGQMDRILVDRGTPVSRGQTLASMADGTVRAQAASARARLAVAQRDFAAADTLFRAGAISERDFGNARSALDAALALAAQADESLGHAVISAPIAGVVSDRVVSPGEAVRIGDKLFTVVNSDDLELAGHVAADQVGRVRVGQAVELRLDAYPDRAVTGRIVRIEPVADPASRQVGVYVRVPNASHSLVGGLFATGTIVERGAVAAIRLAVPASAVRERAGSAVVYVVEANTIRVRPVELGARDAVSGFVEVRSGLSAGAVIVVSPTDRLRDGSPVRVAAAAEPGAGRAGGR